MGAYTSLATLGLNLALSRQAQKNEAKQLKDERDRQVRDIVARDAEARRQQEQSLRRRLAEERARAGAAGVGGSGGSADAVLRGLEEESRAVQDARSDETARRLDLARETFGQRRRSSLLDYTGRWLSLGADALGGGTGGRRRRNLLD
jgi:hypothetical protein